MKNSKKIWAYDRSDSRIEVDPCPFCGSNFIDESYDRKTRYTCPECKYSKYFPGLIQDKKTQVRVPHVDKDGNSIKFEDEKYPEYYHQYAHADAITEMNKRFIE